ncbi:MAG: Ig-like domain-containing protein [Firmicutes bacterium]|nr:Ig-like domain-containing protein [Bacillota bacterium]
MRKLAKLKGIFVVVVFAVLATLTFSACFLLGDDNNYRGTVSVSMNSTPYALTVGGFTEVTATVRYSSDTSVIWSTSDANILSISAVSGERITVTAVGVGTATITATSVTMPSAYANASILVMETSSIFFSGGSLHWVDDGRDENTRYTVYLDRNNGRGFERINPTLPTPASTHIGIFNFRLAAGGNYTVRVWCNRVERRQWSKSFRFGGHLAANYEFIAQGGELTWDGRQYGGNHSTEYRVYVERASGFEFVSQIPTHHLLPRITFTELNLSVGKNRIRVNGNASSLWRYLDGVLIYTQPIGYWEIEVEEVDTTEQKIEADYNFTVQGSSFRWNGSLRAYRVYVEGNDGQFRFIENHHPTNFGVGFMQISRLNLTPGKNTVRVVSSGNALIYQNGVIKRGITVGYWEVEHKQEQILFDYNFVVSGANFSWDRLASNAPYRVYINRDGVKDNFEFVMTASAVVQLSGLNLTEGENIVRVVQVNGIWDYKDGVLTFGQTKGYWEIEHKLGYIYNDYNFVVSGANFNWNRLSSNAPYRVYINRDGVKDNFEFVTTVSGAVQLSGLNLTEGENVVRVVQVNSIWDYKDGTLTFGQTKGYWEFYCVQESVVYDYNFTVPDFTQFSWGVYNVSYRVYVNRHDGTGVHFVGIDSRELSALNLTAGDNTVRVVSTINVGRLTEEGVLTFGVSTGYWDVRLVEESLPAGYNFTVVDDAFRWNGINANYRVYVDRYDWQGFVFVDTFNPFFGNAQRFMLLSALNLTSGNNTVRVVRNEFVSFQNETLTRHRYVGEWSFSV